MTDEPKGWMKLPVSKLILADWNYKEDDAEKALKLKNNIERNGQMENIIVRELDANFYEVVNGNHRLAAFKELGTEQVVCFNLGSISVAQAKRIAIETNETRFDTDTIKLADLLRSLVEGPDAEFEIPELAVTMPFNEQEIEDKVKLLTFDWNQFQDKPAAGKEITSKEISCPECGHLFRIE